MHPTRPSILATSAIALVVASQPLAWAAGTTLSPAHFDAQRNAVVVPYTGAFPAFTSATLGGPPRVYFDFNGSPTFVGVPHGSFPASSELVSWAMARRGAQVRLTLTLKHALRVQALNDAAHHEVLLVPQGAGAAKPVKPVGKSKAAPKGGYVHTFKQTFGDTDFRYTVGPRPRGAVHDQVSVNVGSNGVTDFHVHSEPQLGKVAFSIAITSARAPLPHPRPAATPKPLPTPSPELMPSPLPTPEPLATEAATPSPLPTPGEAASATPSPLPTPMPTPTPTPAPAAAAPSNVISLYGDYPLSVTENASNLGSEFAASGGALEGGRWEGHYGALDLLLDVAHHSEQLTDQQTSGATSQSRDTYRGLLGVGWRFTPLGMDDALGVGYMVRYMSNNTLSQAGGSVPPAASAGLLMAPTLLYHGPAVYARIDWPLFGPLGLDVHGGVAPFMFDAFPTTTTDSTGASTTHDLTGMLGYWATPSLYLRFGAFQLSGGYALANYSATSYSNSRSGPEARVDWRF